MASYDARPSSTSCATIVAVKVLVIDPIWKTLSAVVVTPVRVLSTPNGTTVASPSAQTPSTAPGTRRLRGQCSQSLGPVPDVHRRQLVVSAGHVVGVGGGS